MIPHSRPALDETDIDHVLTVLRSGQIAQGPEVVRFESILRDAVGTSEAVAVSSGTAGLHLALLALNIGKGDEVLLPSFVCTALLNAVFYVQATPVLVDVDPRSGNLSAEDTQKRMSPRTKAILLPHLFGQAADMDAILALGVPVIEDCAQSLGAAYKGRPAGSFGILSVFSFYATKVIAAGEGGMVLSSSPELSGMIRDLRDYDEKETYRVRYNYKMTDLQAALGVSQMAKLPGFTARRRALAARYDAVCDALGISRLATLPDGESIHYRYVLLVDQPEAWIDAMADRGIACRRPIYRPLHRFLGISGFPATESLWERAVSLPLYPSLTDGEATTILDALAACHALVR